MPEQLSELNDFARIRERQPEFPVYSEYEFLSLIYNGDEEPSITEMGLTYQGHLEEMDKHKTKKEREQEQKVDENVGKVMYEIGQRLATTAAICSGSTATAFPILTALMVRGSLKQIYTDKRKIETIT